MNNNLKSGDVAVVRFAHGQTGPVFRIDGRRWVDLAGNVLAWDEVREARPLVVIDPEDREQVERLLRAYWKERTDSAEDVAAYPNYVSDLADALRSLIAPPKPEEPTGLGAVVEDENGRRQWVRWSTSHDLPWRLCEHGSTFPQRWQDIPVVRVLSPGVTA